MSPPSGSPAARLLARAAGEVHVFPRQFWLFSAGTVVLLAGVDMCFPFETTFLNTRLGASMTTIGLMLGLPILAVLPLHMLGGALTDKYGRKPGMAIGVCVLISLYWTFALSRTLWQIGIAVALEAAFGWALFLTASNAMIADLVRHERRAEAYGITRASLNVGMVMGPLFGGLLITGGPGYRTVFLTGGGICAGFLVIVLLLFKETRPAVAGHHATLRDTLAGYGVVLHDRRFLTFCAMALLPLYGFGQIWSVLPVALRSEHGTTPAVWGRLLAFYALTGALFQYPVIRWLRRRDHLLALAAASAFVGFGLAGAVLAPYGWATFAFVFVLGEGIVLLIPLCATVAAELAPIPLRGRYMGAWTLVQMGGYALGPTFGGLAMDRLGTHGAFALVGALGLLGAALFALGAGRFRRPVREDSAAGERAAEQSLGAAPPIA